MELSSIPLKLDMFEMKLWKTYSNWSLFKCIYVDYTEIKMKIICKRVLTETRQTKMSKKIMQDIWRNTFDHFYWNIIFHIEKWSSKQNSSSWNLLRYVTNINQLEHVTHPVHIHLCHSECNTFPISTRGVQRTWQDKILHSILHHQNFFAAYH